MKNLISNIWNMPASTFAGGVLALLIWAGSDMVEIPEPWGTIASGLAILIGALYPRPLKPKSKR